MKVLRDNGSSAQTKLDLHMEALAAMTIEQMKQSVKGLQTHLRSIDQAIKVVQERQREWNERDKVIKQMTDFRQVVHKQLKELRKDRPWLKKDYKD